MFPVRVVVETIGEDECSRCSVAGGALLVDSYAIVGGHTPLSQLIDTVMTAIGLQHLAAGAKGMIQLRNWKPLTFDQVSDDQEATVECLLKDISNHLTLKILTRRVDSALKDCVLDIKERLLKAILNRNPQILASIKNSQLKDFVAQLLDGTLQPNLITADHIHGFNNWLEEISRSEPYLPSVLKHIVNGFSDTDAQSASTRFNNILEVPKLQRWFLENPNPTRHKLLQYMHLLNTSNFRKHNSKISYQQICNWFSNSRAMHRQRHRDVKWTRPSPNKPLNNGDVTVDFNDLGQKGEQEHLNSEKFETPNELEQVVTDSSESAVSGSGMEEAKMENPESLLINAPDHVSGTGSPFNAGTPGAAHLFSPQEVIPINSPQPHQQQSSPDSQPDAQVCGDGAGSAASRQLFASGLYNGNRSRLMFDPLSELPLLEKWFDENPHPSWIQIDQFTESLNLLSYRQTYPPVSTHNVKIWFKNRRAKCKRLLSGHGDK